MLDVSLVNWFVCLPIALLFVDVPRGEKSTIALIALAPSSLTAANEDYDDHDDNHNDSDDVDQNQSNTTAQMHRAALSLWQQSVKAIAINDAAGVLAAYLDCRFAFAAAKRRLLIDTARIVAVASTLAFLMAYFGITTPSFALNFCAVSTVLCFFACGLVRNELSPISLLCNTMRYNATMRALEQHYSQNDSSIPKAISSISVTRPWRIPQVISALDQNEHGALAAEFYRRQIEFKARLDQHARLFGFAVEPTSIILDPATVISTADNPAMTDKSQCPICLDQLTDCCGKSVAFHCHDKDGSPVVFYHHECLQNWVNIGHRDCPSCKQPLSLILQSTLE